MKTNVEASGTENVDKERITEFMRNEEKKTNANAEAVECCAKNNSKNFSETWFVKPEKHFENDS